MQIAGPEPDGILDEAIDQDADFNSLGDQVGLEILQGVAHAP
jgi:hypothetical protein